MARKKKPVAATNGGRNGKNHTTERPRGYVVAFPDEEAHLRAMRVLGRVPFPYPVVADAKYGALYGLTPQHVEALQQEEIPFEVVS